MTINWAELQGQAADFKVLPPNDYPVIITKAEAVKAQTGKDMIKVTMKVEGGPHDGRAVYNNFVLSPENPNALGMFFKQMALFGMDASYFAQNPSLELVAEHLVGKRCTVAIKTRVWQGSEQSNVDAVKPYNPGLSGASPGGPGIPTPPPPSAPLSLAPEPQTPASAPPAPPPAPGSIAQSVVAANAAAAPPPPPAPPAPSTPPAPLSQLSDDASF